MGGSSKKGGPPGGGGATKIGPPPTVSMPAFMPGMDNTLAQQLSMGGYGSPQGLLAYLRQMHPAMQMPTQSVIMDPKSGVKPKPNTTQPPPKSKWDGLT